MTKVKEDRRVKYTKMVLKQSLIDLLGKKDISSITIKRICEDADINRATFYSHYADQYDLLRKIEDEFYENLKAYISRFQNERTEVGFVDLTEKIFQYIKDDAKLCKILLSKQGDIEFQKKIMMLVYGIEPFTTAVSKTQETEQTYIYAFILTGCVGVVQKWLDEGMKQSAKFMAELIFDTVRKFPIVLI